MNVMTAKPQGFRSQGASARIFLERIGNAAPAQVLFCLFPQGGVKFEPRHPLPSNALLWDLNAPKISVRQDRRQLGPQLGNVAPLESKITNKAPCLKL